VEEPLDSTAEIDERAVRHDRRDAAGQDRSGDDGPADLLGLPGLLLLQEGASRDDQLLAVLLALDDPERVALPDVDEGSAVNLVSICEIGQKARCAPIRTSYPPLIAFSTRPSTGSPARKASLSRCRVTAPRASLWESFSPPTVETTTAWTLSPTFTGVSLSGSTSSSRSMVASPFPPISTNATSPPIATMIPSTVSPSRCDFGADASSSIRANSSLSSESERGRSGI